MDLGLRPELRTAQELVQTLRLSPAMIQSMEILQLTSLDLQEKIEEELEENPVLDLAEDDPEGGDEEAPGGAAEQAPAADTDTATEDQSFSHLEDFSQSGQSDWDDYDGARRKSYSGDEDPKLEAMQNVEGRPLTMAEHLEGQLAFITDDDRLLRICREIVGNLDDNGYLRGSLEEILSSLGEWEQQPTHEELGAALNLIQTLDPPGVGARDLRECLLLQLFREPNASPLQQRVAEAVIRDHLEDLGRNRLPKIARDLKKALPESTFRAGRFGTTFLDDIEPVGWARRVRPRNRKARPLRQAATLHATPKKRCIGRWTTKRQHRQSR